MEDSNVEHLCNVVTEAEAYLIKGLLKAEEIKVLIKPLEVVMYEGVYGGIKGVWGDLFVLPEDLEKAQTILSDYMASKPEEGDFFEQGEIDDLDDEEDLLDDEIDKFDNE
jgi:hypothetical protein